MIFKTGSKKDYIIKVDSEEMAYRVEASLILMGYKKNIRSIGARIGIVATKNGVIYRDLIMHKHNFSGEEIDPKDLFYSIGAELMELRDTSLNLSGVEAKMLWAKGESIQVYDEGWRSLSDKEYTLSIFDSGNYSFRLQKSPIVVGGEKIDKPNSIVVCGITGAVGLVYNDIDKAKKNKDSLLKIMGVM